MSYCQGNVGNCDAEEFYCEPCAVMACSLHGHIDEGDDPDCEHLCDEWEEFFLASE